MDRSEYQQQEIDRMVDALGLEASTGRLAEVLVGTCEVAGACQGRSTEELVAGCVYLAIREEREPVSLSDLGDVVAIRMTDICRAYQDIVDTLEVQLEPESPIKYVDEFVARLNEQFDSKLGEDVAETARALGADLVTVPPYAPVDDAAQTATTERVRRADATLVAPVALADGNLSALRIAAASPSLVVVDGGPVEARNHAGAAGRRVDAALRDRGDVVDADSVVDTVRAVVADTDALTRDTLPEADLRR